MMHNIQRIKTGIPGLDDILGGGLVPVRGYLIRGGPGTGKTTLGMHFLAEGAMKDEKTLFITLGESESNLKANAKTVNIDTSSIAFLDLSPSSEFFVENKSYDLFTPADIERDPLTQKIIAHVDAIKPTRVFLDSTSHLRYLSIDIYQFRKQLLAFIRFLLEQEATVLFTSESTPFMPDDDVMYLSDGVINLSLIEDGRRIEITKFRGSNFISGQHTFNLTEQGARVYSKLKPFEHQVSFQVRTLSSGIQEVDMLLNGGIEQGTISIISGPAGVGKTTLGLQFLKTAAENNQRCLLFSFEENTDMLIYRAEQLQIPLRHLVDIGIIKIIPIEPLLYSADEVSHMLRREIEGEGAKLVMLDSMAGYKLAIRDQNPIFELRNLFKYLTNMGVTALAINETEAITGDFRATEMGISFMTDNIIFIRYIELRGEMKKAIGVLKKRLSAFERHLREFMITNTGIYVGQPLTKLRGILKGTPEWIKDDDNPNE